jgi:hypothetical protein
METTTLFETVRALIRSGETGQALAALRAGLEQDTRFAPTIRALEVLESNYHSTHQQELKGIIAPQEAQRTYNQLNDNLLSIIADLSAGRQQPPGRTKRSSLLLMAAAGAVVLGVVVFFLLKQGKNHDCPSFSTKSPHILILPFQRTSGPDQKPEVSIQSHIQTLSVKNNFGLEVKIVQGYNGSPDFEDARHLAEGCHASMVIWGTYGTSKTDSLLLTTQFVFARDGSNASTTGLQRFRDTGAVEEGTLLKGLDDAVFELCGMMAIWDGNIKLAKKWFEKMQVKTPEEARILEKLQAEN